MVGKSGRGEPRDKEGTKSSCACTKCRTKCRKVRVCLVRGVPSPTNQIKSPSGRSPPLTVNLLLYNVRKYSVVINLCVLGGRDHWDLTRCVDLYHSKLIIQWRWFVDGHSWWSVDGVGSPVSCFVSRYAPLGALDDEGTSRRGLTGDFRPKGFFWMSENYWG